MLATRSTCTVVVVLATLVCTGAAVRCYIGTETNTAIDCMGSCTKTSMIDDDDWWMRACWPTRMEDRCQTNNLMQMETCYCNNDYCNAATPTSLSSLLLLAPLLLSFLLHHIY